MREFTKSDFHIYHVGEGYELVFDGKTLAYGTMQDCDIALENTWDEYCDACTEHYASLDYENRFY